MTDKILPCVLGLGYVGLPVFTRLQKKFTTVGFDIDKKRILDLKKRVDTNNEFSRNELIFRNKSFLSNSIKDIAKCNFFIVTVPTPLKKNKTPDLNSLFNACKSIVKFLKNGDIIVFESTVYPGTSELLTKKIF